MQAETAGAFGVPMPAFVPHVPDRVRPGIGDVAAAARDAIGVFDRKTYPGEAPMLGHHGSMTPAEQLVPLLLTRR